MTPPRDHHGRFIASTVDVVDMDDTIIDAEIVEDEPSTEVAVTTSNEVAIRNPFAEWQLRLAEIQYAKFDHEVRALLAEGRVEALANAVARLERDRPEMALPRAISRQPAIMIAADIAERYGVAEMLAGNFDDTVQTVKQEPVTEAAWNNWVIAGNLPADKPQPAWPNPNRHEASIKTSRYPNLDRLFRK
jgi:hypothetical protein